MRICKFFQLASILLFSLFGTGVANSATDIYSVAKPEINFAMAILGTPQGVNYGAVFSGSSGSIILEIAPDKSYIVGKLILSSFGTPVERVDIHLGQPGSKGPLVFVLPFEDKAGEEEIFTLTENDYCPPRLCDLENLRTSGVATFAQAIGNIQLGKAYIEVHTSKHSEGELVGDISAVPTTSASIGCHPWGCACEGYDSCNTLIAACASGGTWRCMEYNEWGGCVFGACVTLETDDMNKVIP